VLRQQYRQVELIVLRGERDLMAAIGQDAHGAIEMAHVRHPVQDEEDSQL
jgi:hypothetical protein